MRSQAPSSPGYWAKIPVIAYAKSCAARSSSPRPILECERVLIRALTIGEIDEGTAADRRAALSAAAAHWHILRVSPEIVERAGHPFPAEPIRTLDAIHLASALTARSAISRLELLSLDSRIRESGRQLGFRLRPEA